MLARPATLTALAGLLLAAGSGCARTFRIEGRWHLAPWQENREAVVLDPDEFIQPDLRGGTGRREFIIQDSATWRAMWESARKPVPEVNFKTHFIIGACRLIAGDSTHGFYISHVEKREGGAVVHVMEQIEKPGCCSVTMVYGEEGDYILIEKPKTEMPFVVDNRPFWLTK